MKEHCMLKKLLTRPWLVMTALSIIATTAWASSDKYMGAGSLDPQQLKTLHLMNASIGEHSRIGPKEIKRFVAMMRKDKTLYGDAYPAMKKALSEAAKTLPEKGTTFDAYIRKAIELSGKKEALDKNAQQYGYRDAFEQTIESHRIIRAVMHISLEEKLQNTPKEMREKVLSAARVYMPKVNAKDEEYVLPYMRTFESLKSK